jgi:tRNA (guanine37-N1)-methyltransferase
MRIDFVTLFPDFFQKPLEQGLVGKAMASGAVEIGYIDPRAYTTDRHRTVDDAPYGGGGGMVMKPEPMLAAIVEAKARGSGPVILMTPQGKPLEQRDLVRWSRGDHLVLVCGRYEGFDERIRARADEEASLGDFVLTGGEYAALAIADGVVRLLPGTLGNAGSLDDDSFSAGLLEYPQYTRPPELDGARVPEVLLSGNHAEIAAWRRAQALIRTHARRPDLLVERPLSKEERRALLAASDAHDAHFPTIDLAIVLGEHTASALRGPATWACIELLMEAYEVGALAFPSTERVGEFLAQRREYIAVTAAPEAVEGAPGVGPRALRERALRERRPILLVLGHGLVEHRGKHAHVPPWIEAVLPIVRAGTARNELPLEAAAAVLLDRILGER